MIQILVVHPDNSTDLIEQEPKDCGFPHMHDRYQVNYSPGNVCYDQPSKTEWTFDGCGFKWEKTYGGVRQYTKDGAVYRIYLNQIDLKCERWWRHKHINTCYEKDITNENIHAKNLIT